MSIAMVYDASIRNNGTAVLCWDAMKRGVGFGEDLHRYEPHGTIPKHDFYLYIDDGRDGLDFECPHPNAYWAIDTHLGYEYRAKKAKGFDHVFCAQRFGAEQMRRDAILQAEWLPLACHPPANPSMMELMIHPDRDRLLARGTDKAHDVAFVGFLNQATGEGFNNRVEYLDVLFRRFPNFWLTTNCFFEDMAVRFARARVGVNISIRNDLNMRFFEVLSTGTCLLTNRDVEGFEALGFVEDEDFVGFQGIEEMCEKMQWCLDNPGKREEIARRGHEKVRAHHTYTHRMRKILEVCGVSLPEEKQNGSAAS